MFSEIPKEPALIISSFRKELNREKPVLKAAFLNGDIFVGDNQLVNLTKIKTKNELIGEVIGLLMSPIQRVIGALQNRPETVSETEVPKAKTNSAPEAAAVAQTETSKVEAPKAEATGTPAVEASAAPKAGDSKPAADSAESNPESESK